MQIRYEDGKIKQSKRIYDNYDIACGLFTFMYIFYFRLQYVPVLSRLESTTILGLLLFIYLFLSVSYRRNVYSLLQKKETLKILLGCSMLILLAVFITSLHCEFEFSICRPLVHQLIFIIVGIEFYAYLIKSNKQVYLFEYILFAYVAQSIIQYAAFLIPPFNTFTDLFKTEEIIILKQQYDGFRLNAISGGLAFSLAGAYAIVTTIYVFRWNEIRIKNSFYKIIILFILLAGGLAAGRTAILLDVISFIVFIGIKLLKKTDGYRIKQSTLAFICLVPVFIILGMLIIPPILERMGTDFSAKLETVSYWLTKWTSEYFRIGDTGSDYDFWNTNYSVFLKIENPWLGDGIYTNVDGTYYLNQDAGYIRILAFGGVIWAAAMFFYQKLYITSRKRRTEGYTILLLLLIGTLKADCLAIDLQTQLVLIVMYFLNKEEERKGIQYGMEG